MPGILELRQCHVTDKLVRVPTTGEEARPVCGVGDKAQ